MKIINGQEIKTNLKVKITIGKLPNHRECELIIQFVTKPERDYSAKWSDVDNMIGWLQQKFRFDEDIFWGV